jgi:hypothetical protein
LRSSARIKGEYESKVKCKPGQYGCGTDCAAI